MYYPVPDLIHPTIGFNFTEGHVRWRNTSGVRLVVKGDLAQHDAALGSGAR